MVQVADTSTQAFKKISTSAQMSILDAIEKVVADACRRGVRDLSAREIQEPLETALGRRVDMNVVSARIKELLAADRLQRDPTYTRACSVTGQQIHPLKVLPKQTRAFY